MNRFLFTRFCLPLIAALAMLAALAPRWLAQPALDSSADRLLASDPRNRETYEKLSSLLPENVWVLAVMEMDDLFSDTGAGLVGYASHRLGQLPGCQEVKSLTHSGRPVRRGLMLDIEPFFPSRASAAEWAEIRAFTTRFPLSRNVLVSADGRYALLIGLFERHLPDHAAREAFRREVEEALAPLRPRVRDLHLLSFPFIEAEGTNAIRADLQRYLLAAAVLIPLILLLTFRSWAAVATILLLEAAGVALLLGLFAFLGRAVDLYNSILFPLTGGLQLTFGVHYLSALRRACRNLPPPAAAAAAFREVFAPSLAALLTTLAGLAALAFSDLPTVRDFGRLGALTVSLMFVLTFLLPALHARRGAGPLPDLDPAVPRWTRIPTAFPVAVLLLFALISLGLLSGLPRIRTDVRAMEFIHPGHPIRRTLELLNHELGGTNIFQLRIDSGRPGGLQTREVLEYLEKLRARALAIDGVSDAYAYSQLYTALDEIWEGKRAAVDALPASDFKLQMYSQLLNNSPLLFQDAFVDAEARSSLLILRSRDMPASEYLALLETFLAQAETDRPPGVRLEPVQGLHTLLQGDRDIVRNQLRSLGVSLAVIGLMLCLLWRSFLCALAVLLANLPALAAIFGGMGLSGFPLNSVTVMVAAVLIGISVDDGIHLVSAFRAELRKGLPPPEALQRALANKTPAMACTSAILAVFLGLLAWTSFPPVAHFGILGALGVAVAFPGAVWLLPALLTFFFQPARSKS